MTDFHGVPTGSLSNGTVRLDYLTRDSLRIVRFAREADGVNLLAETPDIQWPTPAGPYVLFGGHRLWHAPQAPFRTDIPNRGALTIEPVERGVRITQETEVRTGIQKILDIQLDPEGAGARIRHVVRNQNLWAVELAPWAITMMPLGGVAFLPLPDSPRDPAGQGPNRNLIFWPYSRLRDPRWEPDDPCSLVRAFPLERQWKVGCEITRGWIAYLRGGTCFVKRFAAAPGRPLADMGCNVEIYCNDRFIELETLGGLTAVPAGGEAVHDERWEAYPAPILPHAGEGIPRSEVLQEWMSVQAFL